MKVVRISESQKNVLLGKDFAGASFFNPKEDKNGSWVISLLERDKGLDKYPWLAECEEINYEAKEIQVMV